jgi:hypothetical protein
MICRAPRRLGRIGAALYLAAGCSSTGRAAPDADEASSSGRADAAWDAFTFAVDGPKDVATFNADAAGRADAGTGSDVVTDGGGPDRQVTAPTRLSNFDSRGLPTVRFDIQGHAIDAHDGQLRLFGQTYYLYGTSYDCGFVWRGMGAPFCGFKAYSSPDLVHWTDRGTLFDAQTPTWQGRCDGGTYGCYRPHVVFNARTSQYVLWVNSYDVGVGYHVLHSPSPTGPFLEDPLPELGVNGQLAPGVNNGDQDVFVDDDGSAYLVYTDWRRGGDIVVERLDDTYLSGSGMFARLGIGATEAPAMFKREGRYYVTMSLPNCGYCTTGTGYMSAPRPLGPWTGQGGQPIGVSADSCGGQPAAVTGIPTLGGGTVYLFQSDLWNNGAPNEALANYYWGPLEFAGDGSIQPIKCQASPSLDLAVAAPGAFGRPQGLDQTTGTEGFHLNCGIGPAHRLQTFTPGRTGRLTRLVLTTFKQGQPDGGLTIDIVTIGLDGQPGRMLATATVPSAGVGWSARGVTFDLTPPMEVTVGQAYGFVAHATLSAGCFGFAYNDERLYPAGQESYSLDAGRTWHVEGGRALKFTTTVE